MLNEILLPLDGSPLAERALTYAALLARRTGATVELLEAVQPASAREAEPSTAQLDRAEDYLDEIAGRLGALGVSVTTHLSYDEPVPAILDASERLGSDLIVMSTHGRGGLSRMLYGSVADQVLRRANTPVLLVPSIVEHTWPAEGPLSVLVPLDGSQLAEEALRTAEVLTESFGAKLTLLRVVQRPVYPLDPQGLVYLPDDLEAEEAASHQYLGEQAARLAETGQDVSTRVTIGEPARVIGEVARQLAVDVVVMATHGMGGLGRLILGSIATGTLRHTTAPLLLVRPPVWSAADDGPARPLPTVVSSAATPLVDVAVGPTAEPVIHVDLSPDDLTLIEESLEALGFAPGYDHGRVEAAHWLADRLKSATATAVRDAASTT